MVFLGGGGGVGEKTCGKGPCAVCKCTCKKGGEVKRTHFEFGGGGRGSIAGYRCLMCKEGVQGLYCRSLQHITTLPPFSLLRDFSFQNTAEHFAIRFRQSYLIWKVCDVTAIELSSKE